MRKISFILFLALSLILFFLLLRNGAFSQRESTAEADSLTQNEMKQWAKKKIVKNKDSLLSEAFFDKWEQASAKYARLHSNPKIDSIYQKIFTYVRDSISKHDPYGDRAWEADCKYIVLPCLVDVCDYDTMKEQDTKDYRKEAIVGRNLPGYELKTSRYYIPHIASDKPVLYDFPSIREVLEKYIDKNEDEVRDRVKELRKYFPVDSYHWGHGWYFSSMPIIFRINLYDKCVIVNTRTSWCTGGDFYLPLGSDEIKWMGGWME